MFDREVAISFSPNSDDLLVFINTVKSLYFDFIATLTVCIHGVGITVTIFSSLCKHFQLWANLYRRSKFELNLLFSAE